VPESAFTTPSSTRIVVVATETARAVLKLLDFEGASPRLWGMMWGAEDLAASLGASPWRRFRDVIVPNAVPGILAGSLMVVTLSLGEFNLTWMLHTPLTKTLPIGLADSYASMRLEVASAYTLIFFIMIIPLLVAMQLFADKDQKR